MSAQQVGWVDASLRELIAPPIGAGVATDDLIRAAALLAGCGASCLEVLDPVSAKRSLERWAESPWDRLRAVVRMVERTPVGIYIAGRSLFGERPVGPDLVRRLVLCAAESGASRVRAFDPLNHADALLPVAEAAREASMTFVPVLHLGPAPGHADACWVDEAARLAALPGASAIAVADGGGHLTPTQLADLVRRVREATSLPVEVAVVATGGLAAPASLAAIQAGASVVHAAVGAAALVSGRPSVETIRAALEGSDRALSCDRAAIEQASRLLAPRFSAEVVRQGAHTANGPALGLPPKLAVGLSGRLSRLGLSDRIVAAAEEASVVARECGGLTVVNPFGEAIVAQAVEHIVAGERWRTIEATLADAVLGRWGELRGPVHADAAAGAAQAGHDPHEVALSLEAASAGAPAGLSEEDLLLWTQFPAGAERLHARRNSIDGEAFEESVPALDRDLLETLVSVMEEAGGVEVSVELHGARVTARPAAAGMAAAPAAGQAAAPVVDADGGFGRIQSPIVGTFYSASSPEADPFVKEGQRVAVGDTLCIIEAMKIFNEILAEADGVIRKVAVENAEPVEFGQLLFLIES